MQQKPQTLTQDPASPAGGRLILLADDALDNQRLVQFFLERAGYDVHIVANGEEAVTQVRRQSDLGRHYDLILMDIQMPRLDGFEATRAIRELGFSNPIIALTASSLPADKQLCLDAGCDDYLAKPFDFEPLLTLIAAKLES